MDSLLDKSSYETEEEYRKRIDEQNRKIFNKRFIFDYKEQYIGYASEEKLLYVPFVVTYKNLRRAGSINRFNRVSMSKNIVGKWLINGTTFTSSRIITSSFIHSNVEVIPFHNAKRKFVYAGVVIKKNCSPLEAK